ncbi:MAG: hypothetical protein KAJ53_02210 [Anaerolineales bacterium]|nr:hypothetical protein [Anaerolineales bacterium]
MSDTKQTYQAEILSAPILELRPRPKEEAEAKGLAASSIDSSKFPFSREVIQRLIDRIKEE